MTVQIAAFLLMICAVVTSLITEAIKKTFQKNKPTVTALIVSVAVGIAVPVGYMIIMGLPFTGQDLVYIIAMVVLTWLCATLGYDTVITALSQIIGAKK